MTVLTKQIPGQVARRLLAVQARQLQHHEDLFVEALREMFRQQSRAVIGLLDKTNKAISTKLSHDDDGIDEELSGIQKLFRGIFTAIGVSSVATGFRAAIDQFSLSESIRVLNPKPVNPAEDAALARLIDRRLKLLNDQTSKTTSRAIKRIVEDADSVGVAKEGIKGFMTGPNAEYRALRIARTESVALHNRAAEHAFAKAGIQKKRWLTNQDKKTCQFCPKLNGKIVGVGENYFNKGDQFVGERGGVLRLNYDNTPTPPIHPNCRCTIIPA